MTCPESTTLPLSKHYEFARKANVLGREFGLHFAKRDPLPDVLQWGDASLELGDLLPDNLRRSIPRCYARAAAEAWEPFLTLAIGMRLLA